MPIDLNPTFFGRPSRGAAFALIARLRLQQASPLYNGGQAARTAFGNWKRTVDGANYVNLNYDETRWAVAAAACKRVIEMNKYKLHTSPIDPSITTHHVGVASDFLILYCIHVSLSFACQYVVTFTDHFIHGRPYIHAIVTDVIGINSSQNVGESAKAMLRILT